MIIIGIAELIWFIRIMTHYGADALYVDVFISRAALEDVIRARSHAFRCLFAIQLASILSIGGEHGG
jgi:hypothetical protein